jgi:hypothetical protein
MEKKKNGGQFKFEIPKIGTKFTDWEVIDDKLIEIKKHHWGVLCKCVCGNEKHVRLPALMSGRSKGCECRAIRIRKAQSISEGELSQTLYGRYLKSAKVRNIEFNVSMKYLWNLFLKQKGKCALSGLDLVLEKTVVRTKGGANITASPDRINSSLGYVEGNIQWVHKDVNKIKQGFDEDYFINLCQLIINNKNKIK